MKKYFFILIFISPILFAQSGRVIYSIKLDSLSFQDNGEFKTRLMKMKNYANNQQFELNFNNNQSSFKYIESINIDPNFDALDNIIARSAMTTSSDFFYDRINNLEVQKRYDGQLTQKKNAKVDWVISKESKKIDAYLCYKATFQESFVGRISGKKEYTEIIAWFAPNLPFPYGPISFYGLPGLVLELKYKSTTYLVNKILISDKEIIVNFPKGKSISQEEYDKQLRIQLGM